jgi:ArsR family transcriptional regulator
LDEWKSEARAAPDASVTIAPSLRASWPSCLTGKRPRGGAALTHQESLVYHDGVTKTATLDVERAATLFHALSDPTRLALLDMLRGGERCVCELQDALDAAQSRLSFHLKVLKDAGLVSDRKEGRWSYYRIAPDALAEVHDLAVDLQPTAGAAPALRLGACCR